MLMGWLKKKKKRPLLRKRALLLTTNATSDVRIREPRWML